MSETSFSSDKFAPAALPEVYAPRQALLSAYHRAAEERVIYVSAKAGSGKTVSTQLWLNHSKRKTIWIGLDEYDSIPSIFYKQLATGIFSIFPNNESMKEILTSTSFSSSPVEHSIQVLSEIVPDEDLYALVLDDMHLIENIEIFKSLPAVLRRLPSNFVCIILSRHELPVEFELLVKNKQASLITDEDLRFTEEEIRQYFNTLGLFLTPEECHTAYLSTDGWAISVNAVSKSGDIQKGWGYAFSNYFETQIWDKWDDKLRDFCLATAILNEFDIHLAKVLSEREDTRKILEQLSSTNSFLSHLREDTYRYHHLFQDFLREKLASSNVDASVLYKKAALYYKEQGDYSHALRFGMDSGDLKGIDSFLFLFLFQNHRGGVSDYADFLSTFFTKDFPAKAYKDAPALHVLSAWYYYLISEHENFSYHMDAIIQKLPFIAKAGSEFVEFSILAFSVDHRTSLRKKVKMYSVFSLFLKKYTPEGLATNIASFTHNLPYLHRSNVDYSEIAVDPDVLNEIDKSFAPLLGTEWVYIRPAIMGCFSYEKNRLSEAFDYNEQAMAYLVEDSKIEGRISLTVLKHSILWQMNKFAEATQVMEELSTLTESSAQFFTPNLKAYQTKLTLFDGDISAARQWLDEYFVVETSHVELFRAFLHFTTARAHMALGKMEDAQHYLFMLKEYGQNLNRPLDKNEASALLSAIYWALGKKNEATAEMEAVLEQMQGYRYIRVIADEGSAVLPVLKRILNKINREGYTGTLTRIYVNEVILATHSFAKQHRGYLNDKHIEQMDAKPIKLSKQQKNVLNLLAQGYRNVEIGEMTGLKLSTVKTHLYLAYQKLGVQNSMDAVLKARELNLL